MDHRRFTLHAFPTGDIIEIQPTNNEILSDTVAEIILLKIARSLNTPANLIKLAINQKIIEMPIEKNKVPTFLKHMEPNEVNLVINVIKIPWTPPSNNLADTICPICMMVLNGPQQLEDHYKGNKHQKKLMRIARRA